MKARGNVIFIIIIILIASCASQRIQTTTSPEDAAVVLAAQIKPVLQKLSEIKSINVAIVPFSGPKGIPTNFGKKMAALLQKNLLSDKWMIIEREQLEKIMIEHKLVIAGLASEKEYVKASTIAGADFVIMGNTFYGKKAFINVKVINVSSLAVEGVAQVYIAFQE
ncbi:MAG: CsgG/HfaB family protein [Spirochaetes bacterium]|nr:CsgG/HfaB family protein [Spirochaetota bacterium]